MSEQDALLNWMFTGETGISSKTMAAVVLGQTIRYQSHPLDPADLNRCIKLVDRAPSVREAFPRIAELSPQWKAMTENFDRLKEMFVAEVGYDWSTGRSAPKTYAAMKDLGL